MIYIYIYNMCDSLIACNSGSIETVAINSLGDTCLRKGYRPVYFLNTSN